MGKVTTTLSVDETLLKQAKLKFPRQMSVKFEEFLRQELGKKTELLRLQEERRKLKIQIETCNELIQELESKEEI